MNKQASRIKELEAELGRTEAERDKLQQKLEEVRSQLQTVQAENDQLKAAPSKHQKIPDLKTAYEGYKKEDKPGRTFTMKELKPFHIAILKGLTPEKGS